MSKNDLARDLQIDRRARQLVGKSLPSCLHVAIIAYGLPITESDLAIARSLSFPKCVMTPSAATGNALVSFLTQHLLTVSCDDRKLGTCIVMSLKSKGEHADHVGVLTSRGMAHLVHRGKVELVPYGDKFKILMSRTLMALRAP